MNQKELYELLAKYHLVRELNTNSVTVNCMFFTQWMRFMKELPLVMD